MLLEFGAVWDMRDSAVYACPGDGGRVCRGALGVVLDS